MVEDSKHEKKLNWLLLNILKLSIIVIGFTPHWETCRIVIGFTPHWETCRQ